MPFKKKVKAPVDLIDPEVIPSEGNESPSSEKKEKKSDLATEMKLKREVYAKEQELENKNKEIEELRKQLEVKPVSQAPDMQLINQLQGQINTLSQQVIGASQGKKLLFRQPTAADLQEESIVFTARSVIYIVASYTDARGLEQLPPFKLIVFNYAASDIRKEGREEEIKNFSQYTTNLKPEIEFLRSHPYYGITFSENTNEMMNQDTKEMQFKERAATQLASAVPESVYAKADELKIPNWRQKSAHELKHLIVNEMAKIYTKEAQELQDNIIRRQALGNAVLNSKE